MVRKHINGLSQQFTCNSISDILVSFSEGSSVVDESVNNITVCVLVCEGTLKRNAEISLDFYNGTAQCKLKRACSI